MRHKLFLAGLLTVLAAGFALEAFAQVRFLTPSRQRGEATAAKQSAQITTLQNQVNNIGVECPAGQYLTVDVDTSPYTWSCTGETDPQVGTTLTDTKWCWYDGSASAIICDKDDPASSFSEVDPTVTAFAKAALPNCAAGTVLTGDGTSLSCVADAGGSGSGLALNDLDDVTLGVLSNGDILQYNGTAWVNTSFAESDPTVETFAQNPLPTCGAGEVLKSNGTSFSCVNDAGGSASGLALDDLSDVAITAPAAGNVLAFDGAGWVDAIETDPGVEAFAKNTLPTCGASEVLTGDGTSLSCKADDGGVTAEVDPTVTAFAKAALPTCGAGEVLKGDGTSLSCVAGSGAGVETDPTVTAFAKAALPTCGAGQVLKADGTNLSCVSDVGANGDGGLWTNNTGAGDVYISRSGNVAVTGAFGAGDDLPSSLTGAGARMFFYPKKAAIRAGQVTGTQWDEAQIGTHSVAFGLDTQAAGNYSGAFGRELTVSGDYSFGFALSDQNGADVSQANTFAIMGGTVGIGTLTPSSALEVAGNIETTTVQYSSDLKWKTNIATLDDALDRILGLRGVSFDWKRGEFPAKDFPEGRQVGFIAQEVEQVFPELVLDGGDGKTVNYAGLVAPLVEAIKAQQVQIEQLKQRIEDLENR